MSREQTGPAPDLPQQDAYTPPMRHAAVLLMLLLAACSSPSGDSGTADTTPTAAPAPAPAPPARLETAAVQGVLDAWLEAQNAGNFEAYGAQYAAKFFGVKRSGSREYRYDRDGWLADRHRMFRKPMRVGATDVVIKPASTSAVVRFTQTWASGSYEDVGPKQLVVVKEDGALRVAREEMLSSEILREAGRNESVIEFGWVEKIGEQSWVLIGDAPDDLTGPPILMAESPTTGAFKVPDEAAGGRVGSSVTLYGPKGQCPGRLVEPMVMARIHPHWGQAQFWDDEGVSDSGKAGEALSMGTEQLWMRFEPTSGGCSGRWAVDAGVKPPHVYREDMRILGRVGQLALDEFKQMEGYIAVQRSFEAEGHTGAWDVYDGASVQVQGFTHPSGAEVVTVIANAGYGCGDWDGSWWSIWTVRGDKLEQVTDLNRTGVWAYGFDSILDIDQDGVPEVEIDGRVIDSEGEVLIDASVPSFDCSC